MNNWKFDSILKFLLVEIYIYDKNECLLNLSQQREYRMRLIQQFILSCVYFWNKYIYETVVKKMCSFQMVAVWKGHLRFNFTLNVVMAFPLCIVSASVNKIARDTVVFMCASILVYMCSGQKLKWCRVFVCFSYSFYFSYCILL